MPKAIAENKKEIVKDEPQLSAGQVKSVKNIDNIIGEKKKIVASLISEIKELESLTMVRKSELDFAKKNLASTNKSMVDDLVKYDAMKLATLSRLSKAEDEYASILKYTGEVEARHEKLSNKVLDMTEKISSLTSEQLSLNEKNTKLNSDIKKTETILEEVTKQKNILSMEQEKTIEEINKQSIVYNNLKREIENLSKERDSLLVELAEIKKENENWLADRAGDLSLKENSLREKETSLKNIKVALEKTLGKRINIMGL